MMNKISLFIFLFSCQTAWSASHFCPSNLHYINTGDTPEKVEQACGKPADIKKSQTDTAENFSGTWRYYILTPPNGVTREIVVVIQKNNVTAILNNSVNMSSLTLCENGTIAPGDTTKTVEAACGKPAVVNAALSEEGTATPAKKDEIIEYVYPRNNYSAPVTLKFVNGKLID